MQGINGVELYPSEYNHLINCAKANCLKLEYEIPECKDNNLMREKDVEDYLVKPLLEELGYDNTDYVQQLYIEIGNHNHALIPDFVIHPVTSKGHQSAEFLIEVKYSITTKKQLEDAKTQARSYAKMLKANYSVIASKEGVWVTDYKDDYSNDVLFLTWHELKKADNFYKLIGLLGKKKRK